MSIYNSRFRPVEGDGFPAVTEYDYFENIPVRGLNDRSFRWKEVFIKSSYLFQEITTNGEFENLTPTTTYSGTNPNHANAVYGNSNNTSEVSGWVLNGTIYKVNNSGLDFGVSGWAIPITTNNSLGLRAYDRRDNIKITGIPSGEDGIELNNRYQIYILARSVTGTHYLRPYLSTFQGSVEVSRYFHNTESWLPVASGYPSGIPVPSTGYTEIRFDVYTTNIPGALDSFQLIVEGISASYATGTSPSSSSPRGVIIVDSVHLDHYMAKNAFVDYILPTGYLIQITPDLGWHNTDSMFESTSDNANPHLKTLGYFSIDNGNLQDRLDGTVIATVDAQSLEECTYKEYSRYLWRAIAISPNGNLGDSGSPQKFTFIGSILENTFTIDSVLDDKINPCKVIVGSRLERCSILVNGQDHLSVEYPTKTTWKLVYNLESERIKLSLQAKDAGGATSRPKYVDLFNNTHSHNRRALWNVFDDFGLLVDTSRLLKESNRKYKNRIKDVFINRGSSSFVGVVNGAVRELGLNKIDPAFEFSIPKGPFNKGQDTSVDIEVTPYSIRIRNRTCYKEEILLLDPVKNTITLSSYPKGLPILELDGSYQIYPDKIKIHSEHKTYPSRYIISVDVAPTSKFIKAKYNYYIELFYKDYPDVGSMLTVLNSLVDETGEKIVDTYLNPKMSGNESCMGLYKTSLLFTSDQTESVSWSPVYLNKISDRRFREHFVSTDGTFYDTDFYRYVKELELNSRVFWNHAEMDRDYWVSSKISDLSFDDIPTLCDPRTAQYQILQSGSVYNIDAIKAWYRGYSGYDGSAIRNLGLKDRHYQPGVAHTLDLQPDLYTSVVKPTKTDSDTSVISSQKNNNNIVFFSGQR